MSLSSYRTMMPMMMNNRTRTPSTASLTLSHELLFASYAVPMQVETAHDR